jgi:hypothetical protein
VHPAITDAAALSGTALGDGTGAGWLPYRELLRRDRLTALVERTAEWFGGCPTPAARTAAATLALGDVAATVAGPVAAALVAWRRGVTVGPDGLALRFGPGGVVEVAFDDAAVAVLAGDPLTPATVLPDVEALRRTVATGYDALLSPLVEALAPVARRGRRGLRAEAAERLAAALFLAARAAGRPADARAEVEGVVGPVAWVEIPPDGLPWKRRTVCCLAYQIPRMVAAYCATCPLIPAEETVRRTGAWLHGR